MAPDDGDPGPAPEVPGYRVLGRLGSGMHGTVYEGTREADGVPVALKVLEVSSTESTLLARFEREAHLLAEAPHPDLVRLLEARLDEDPRVLVLEFLGGGDLARHARVGDLLPPGEVLAAGVAAARALGHLHARGVVHRDVKPGNLLRDEAGRTRLGDLGLGWSADTERLTRTGFVVGTTAYLAPEILAGGEASPASDLFALGMTLVELLTGSRPAATPGGTEVAWKAVRQRVSYRVVRVLEELLATDPARRPADGAQVAARLGEVSSGADVLGATTSIPTMTLSRIAPRAAGQPGEVREAGEIGEALAASSPPSRPVAAPARRGLLAAVVTAGLALGWFGSGAPGRVVLAAAPTGSGAGLAVPREVAEQVAAVVSPEARVVAATWRAPGDALVALREEQVLGGEVRGVRVALVAARVDDGGPRDPAVAWELRGPPGSPEVLGVAADAAGVAILLAGPRLLLLDADSRPTRSLGPEVLAGTGAPRGVGLTPTLVLLATEAALLPIDRATGTRLAALPARPVRFLRAPHGTLVEDDAGTRTRVVDRGEPR